MCGFGRDRLVDVLETASLNLVPKEEGPGLVGDRKKIEGDEENPDS